MSNQSEIEKIFSKLKSITALVVGDVMVDSYYWGRVERISPEAPVPVVHVEKKEYRLGGAANVALNIKAMGAKPVLCSVVGKDARGETFLSLMKDAGMPEEGIITDPSRMTTVKTRVIGNNHQLLRVDEEEVTDITASAQKQLIARISELITKHKPQVIIFEDYDKGVLNESSITEIIGLSKQHNIVTAVDPKKKNFSQYKGVTLMKPNLKELREGRKIDVEATNIEKLKTVVAELIEDQQTNTVLVTLSEHGVYIANKDNNYLAPAFVRTISDVSGAGDTVISVAALCMAAGLNIRQVAMLANLAGGQVCEKVGVVPVDSNKLMQEAFAIPDLI